MWCSLGYGGRSAIFPRLVFEPFAVRRDGVLAGGSGGRRLGIRRDRHDHRLTLVALLPDEPGVVPLAVQDAIRVAPHVESDALREHVHDLRRMLAEEGTAGQAGEEVGTHQDRDLPG